MAGIAKSLRIKLLLTPLMGVAVTSSADARTWQAGLEGEALGMPYRYYLPADYDPQAAYPLVLFLHGSGQVGTDNVGHVNLFIDSLIAKTESDYPAILVAPQVECCGWSPVAPPGWPEDQPFPNQTGAVLDRVIADLAVDTERLYLTGFSMGGAGATWFLENYNAPGDPFGQRFAAVAPVAGGFFAGNRQAYAHTPVWLFMGGSDQPAAAEGFFRAATGLADDEPIPFDDEPYLGMTFRGRPFDRSAEVGLTRYSEIVGQGHLITSTVYAQDAFYDWMFAQRLAVPEPSSLTMLAAVSALFSATAGRPRGGG